jgi:hypothetical protein
VYGTIVNEPRVGGFRLNFLRIMNSVYLIALENILLESSNFGLSRQAIPFPVVVCSTPKVNQSKNGRSAVEHTMQC